MITAVVVLALHRTALTALLFGVERLRGFAAVGTGLVHALLVLLGVGLAVWVLLLVALSVLLRFLLVLCGVHAAPTAAAI